MTLQRSHRLGTVFVYYGDDILIATRTMEEHRHIVRQVLQILNLINFPQTEKCEFEKDEVEYLGICLQAGQRCYGPHQTQGIADWPTPAKLKDVRAFLGLQVSIVDSSVNYSRLARPLNDLTKENLPLAWGDRNKTL